MGGSYVFLAVVIDLGLDDFYIGFLCLIGLFFLLMVMVGLLLFWLFAVGYVADDFLDVLFLCSLFFLLTFLLLLLLEPAPILDLYHD